MTTLAKKIVDALPFALRDKARSHMDYVGDRFYDILLRKDALGRLDDLRGLIEIVFICRYVFAFLVTAAGSYERLMTYLQQKQVTGIRIGGDEYEAGDALSNEWIALARMYSSLITDSRLRKYVEMQGSADFVLEKMVSNERLA